MPAMHYTLVCSAISIDPFYSLYVDQITLLDNYVDFSGNPCRSDLIDSAVTYSDKGCEVSGQHKPAICILD